MLCVLAPTTAYTMGTAGIPIVQMRKSRLCMAELGHSMCSGLQWPRPPWCLSGHVFPVAAPCHWMTWTVCTAIHPWPVPPTLQLDREFGYNFSPALGRSFLGINSCPRAEHFLRRPSEMWQCTDRGLEHGQQSAFLRYDERTIKPTSSKCASLWVLIH